MSLQADLVKLEGEIKTKTAEWQASSKAVEEAESATAEQVDSLRTGNKELSALIDKKKTLGELIAETEAVNADVTAAKEAEEKALREGRNIQRQGNEGGAGNGTPKEKEEPWTVKATKALLESHPTERAPHRVEKSLKALFNEGAFTAVSGNVPGHYIPANSEGYPPELRRDDALFTPDAVRPVQFWNTIPQIPTTRPTDVYMVETVNADSTSIFTGEGGSYAEDDGYDYNEASNPIKDVGSYYGVTRDILEDEPMMQSILEQRVLERMSRKLDNAFINGASAANTFAGVTHVSNVDTFAKDAAESLQVAITRAIEGINGPTITGRTNSGGQAMADAIYVTVPIYWEFMRQQDALGNFMVSMGLREAPQLRVAGVPVMQCQALASGEILVLDRMYTHIRDRRMVDVYWLDQLVTSTATAGDPVIPAGRRMVVADARVTITVRRPSTVCVITGA